jgi:RNA polymerase sigma-70 factor (ECF subfamily)
MPSKPGRLQDTFAHIWRKAGAYDRGRSSPFTWAVMVTRNKAIDGSVRQRRQNCRARRG